MISAIAEKRKASGIIVDVWTQQQIVDLAPRDKNPDLLAQWVENTLGSNKPGRWRHNQEMYHRALMLSPPDWGDSEHLLLQQAVLTCDIGFAYQDPDMPMHSVRSAWVLDRVGMHQVADLVVRHSGAFYEADWLGCNGQVAPWLSRQCDPRILMVLDWLHYTTMPEGEVSIQERLQWTEVRYGKDSLQYHILENHQTAMQQAALLAGQVSG